MGWPAGQGGLSGTSLSITSTTISTTAITYRMPTPRRASCQQLFKLSSQNPLSHPETVSTVQTKKPRLRKLGYFPGSYRQGLGQLELTAGAGLQRGSEGALCGATSTQAAEKKTPGTDAARCSGGTPGIEWAVQVLKKKAKQPSARGLARKTGRAQGEGEGPRGGTVMTPFRASSLHEDGRWWSQQGLHLSWTPTAHTAETE